MNLLHGILFIFSVLTVPVMSAQPEPIVCPLPPYEKPEVRARPSGSRGDIQVLSPSSGEFSVIVMSDFLTNEMRVLVYRDGKLRLVLDNETLLDLRKEATPYGMAVNFHLSPQGDHLLVIDPDSIHRVDTHTWAISKVFIGITGHDYGEYIHLPDIIWDTENPNVFRALLQTEMPTSTNAFRVPFVIREFNISDPKQPKSAILISLDEPTFNFAVGLSPDGYRVVGLWPDSPEPGMFQIRVYTVGSDQPRILAELPLVSLDAGPWVRWLDETHIEYRYFNPGENFIIQRTDLCSETIPASFP